MGLFRIVFFAVGIVLVLGFAVFLTVLPTIAAWRSRYLKSIDQKLDCLLTHLGVSRDLSDEESSSVKELIVPKNGQ